MITDAASSHPLHGSAGKPHSGVDRDFQLHDTHDTLETNNLAVIVAN